MNRALGVALSFSGSGHLLAYQLGVASRLLAKESSWAHRITCFTGASGGALAAAVCTLLPSDRIAPFAEKEACAGRAFLGLKAALASEGDFALAEAELNFELVKATDQQRLWISATQCTTGDNALFNSFASPEDLVRCLEASLAIPRSFHPLDVAAGSTPAYPSHEGILVHRSCKARGYNDSATHLPEREWDSYCDGGISWTAPVLGSAKNDGHPILPVHTISVSPIVGPSGLLASMSSSIGVEDSDSSSIDLNHWHIAPRHQGFRVPFAAPELGGMRCYLSAMNARAMLQALAGRPHVLRDWFEAGIDNGNQFLNEYPVPP